ncbi:adenosylcobinamide-GDP ribazoletransferase [Dietzia timorensis]|uniref:Adenosylcobinamide-GDP ribazoletransferase n=1 Tax=Dietzia timorensis TaxID=499555 RepID=A0A173LKW9_9ACTN|nr:adenosylcobinamide-GDP ribazoletransferase [Dietzia timorensis]ANI92121.1 Cobalamin synthase [Dietzia timorensis]
MTTMRAAAMIISWMTILPLRVRGPVSRESAGRAISCLPAAGSVVGVFAASLAFLLDLAGATPLLSAALVVAGLAILTRGMHLDGLADTVDALASYKPAAEARQIMREGTVGPLGAGALALVSLVEVAAYAQLIEAGAFAAIAAVGIVSRCLPVFLCRRSIPSAEQGGFGPLVASTQGPASMTAQALITLAAAALAGESIASASGRSIFVEHGAPAVSLGICMCAVICGVAWLFTKVLGRHAVRRLGGISGDILGTAIALGAAITASGFAILAG